MFYLKLSLLVHTLFCFYCLFCPMTGVNEHFVIHFKFNFVLCINQNWRWQKNCRNINRLFTHVACSELESVFFFKNVVSFLKFVTYLLLSRLFDNRSPRKLARSRSDNQNSRFIFNIQVFLLNHMQHACDMPGKTWIFKDLIVEENSWLLKIDCWSERKGL